MNLDLTILLNKVCNLAKLMTLLKKTVAVAETPWTGAVPWNAQETTASSLLEICFDSKTDDQVLSHLF